MPPPLVCIAPPIILRSNPVIYNEQTADTGNTSKAMNYSGIFPQTNPHCLPNKPRTYGNVYPGQNFTSPQQQPPSQAILFSLRNQMNPWTFCSPYLRNKSPYNPTRPLQPLPYGTPKTEMNGSAKITTATDECPEARKHVLATPWELQSVPSLNTLASTALILWPAILTNRSQCILQGPCFMVKPAKTHYGI